MPFEKNVLGKVINQLPINANILDLGYGSCYPYDNYFTKKNFNLIGVDFCIKHIREAKKNNLNAESIVDDIEKFQYYIYQENITKKY